MMKKIIFLFGALYFVFLISCKQPIEKQKSFSDIIKNDSSRVKELLAVADSINNRNSKMQAISNDDELIPAERHQIRSNIDLKIKDTLGPVIFIGMNDMQNIITALNSTCDSLAFCLGSYKKKGPGIPNNRKDRIDRYKERNGLQTVDLSNKPTFVITGKLKVPQPTTTISSLSIRSFDVARLCPPPINCVTQ